MVATIRKALETSAAQPGRETYQRMLPIGLVFFSVTSAAFAMCQSYNTSLLLLTLVGCSGGGGSAWGDTRDIRDVSDSSWLVAAR